METLSKVELKEFLIKNWMTHDALWFLHCLRETDIETTNKINRAASSELGLVEAKRFKKIVGIDEIKNTDDLKKLLKFIYDTIKGDFMKISYEFIKDNEIISEMRQCFAHDGIKRIGVIEQYQCGIYERIEGWYKGLGLKFDVNPQITGCLMQYDKKCVRYYKFSFPLNGSKEKLSG